MLKSIVDTRPGGHEGRKDKKMKIISVYGVNANPFYSPSKSNNGGGYWQPCGVALISLDDGKLVTVEADDLSCGDFGRRASYAVEVDGFRWGWNYSTMDGEYSDSPDKIDAIIGSICGVLGCDTIEILGLAVEAIDIAARNSCNI